MKTYEVTRRWVLVADNQQAALEAAKIGMHEEVIVKLAARADEKDDRYCPKCGQNWAVHNDDGSCVDDELEDSDDLDDLDDFGDETKCWRCQQKAVLNGICGACGEVQE